MPEDIMLKYKKRTTNETNFLYFPVPVGISWYIFIVCININIVIYNCRISQSE